MDDYFLFEIIHCTSMLHACCTETKTRISTICKDVSSEWSGKQSSFSLDLMTWWFCSLINEQDNFNIWWFSKHKTLLKVFTLDKTRALKALVRSNYPWVHYCFLEKMWLTFQSYFIRLKEVSINLPCMFGS